MLFSSKVPLTAMVAWCRALKHGIDVGLSPVRIFRMQATSGPAVVRPLARTLADRMEAGESFEEALKPDRYRFPPLFVELVTVGEHSGRLTETFAELERHFETMLGARKRFLSALIWPGLMYVSAIAIVSLLLLILGLLGSGLDPLGLGLTGPAGAAVFFIAAVMFTAAVIGGVLFVLGNEPLRGKLEGIALTLPGLAGCFRAFALQRFSTALYMTSEAGVRADRALAMSLRAAANERYAAHVDAAAKQARGGDEIGAILARCGRTLFPDEFLNAVHVGEVTGNLAEVMQKQAKHYREEAARKLKFLVMVLSGAIYAMVALLVIVMIFKIATAAYIAPMQDAMQAVDDPDAWLRGGR